MFKHLHFKTLALFSLMIAGAGSAWAEDFTLSSASKVTQYGITVEFDKGSGSTAPTWYDAGLRLYANNTITISADDNITGISFNWEKQGSKAFATATASTGTYTHPTAAGTGSWSGSAKTVTFTIGTGQLQLNTLSVTLEEASGSDDPVDASWSVSPESISVKAGKTATADITTNYNGTLLVASSAEGVATATYSAGILTVTGVSAGTATLTISGDATAKYNAISKTIAVTVLENTATPGTYSITPNNTFYGTTKTYSGNANTNPSSLTGESNGITIVYSKGSQSNFYVSAEQTRTYNGSTMAFSVPNGYALTSIVFTADGTYWAGTHTASTGTMTDNKTWNGCSQDVTITFGGTCRVTSITVTFVATATVTLNPACTDGEGNYYGTYSNSSAFIVPADMTVSEINIMGGELLVESYQTGDIVPANTGVMVSSATSGAHTVTLSQEAGTSKLGTDNLLRATGDAGITAAEMAAADADCLFYRLTMHNGTQIGFWWGAAEGAAFDIAAGKAYLAVPKTSEARTGFALFADDTTAINSMSNEQCTMNSGTYDLQGRRMDSSLFTLHSPLLKIVNGRKVLVK